MVYASTTCAERLFLRPFAQPQFGRSGDPTARWTPKPRLSGRTLTRRRRTDSWSSMGSGIERRAITVALIIGMVMTSAEAQITRYVTSSTQWTPCMPPTGDNYVYFDPGSLSDPARGYNVNYFRAALVRAIAVWNEESLSQQRLIFGGDLTPSSPGPDNHIVVSHDFTRSCGGADTGLAYTQGAASGGAGGPCNGSRSLTVHLQDCSSPPHEVRYSAGIPSSAEYSYEAVLIHELGHAAFGFPDFYNASQGVKQEFISFFPPPASASTAAGVRRFAGVG